VSLLDLKIGEIHFSFLKKSYSGSKRSCLLRGTTTALNWIGTE